MAHKKTIPLLPETTIPNSSGYVIYDDGTTTYKITLDNLSNFIYANESGIITGGTYDNNTGTISFTTKNGLPIYVTGLTKNIKNWIENENKILGEDETVTISGDYVLVNSDLTLLSGNTQFSMGSLVFKKTAKIFIGGSLLLVDSNIINDGEISVAGGILLSGNSTITGNGIII